MPVARPQPGHPRGPASQIIAHLPAEGAREALRLHHASSPASCRPCGASSSSMDTARAETGPGSSPRSRRAAAALGGGPALRGHEPAEGPGVLLRRDGGGADQRPHPDPGPAGRVADLVLPVQGQGGRRARDRPAPGRPHPARGERADGRGADADRGAADQRGRRLPALVVPVRPGDEGRLRGPGRDRRQRSSPPSASPSSRRTTSPSSSPTPGPPRSTSSTSRAATSGTRGPRTACCEHRVLPGAIDEDPGYARAHAGLADSYVLLGIYGIRPPTEVMPKAKATAGPGPRGGRRRLGPGAGGHRPRRRLHDPRLRQGGLRLVLGRGRATLPAGHRARPQVPDRAPLVRDRTAWSR